MGDQWDFTVRGADIVVTLRGLEARESVIALTPLQRERIRLGKLWLLQQQKEAQEDDEAEALAKIPTTVAEVAAAEAALCICTAADVMPRRRRQRCPVHEVSKGPVR